jgi:hypothetical protein
LKSSSLTPETKKGEVAQTVYAKTKDDCEAKLAELVARMREEWIAKKNVMESTEMVEPAMRI